MNAPLTEPVFKLRPWGERSQQFLDYPITPQFLGHVSGVDFWLTASRTRAFITFRWDDRTDDFNGWCGYPVGSPHFKNHGALASRPEALEFCRTLHLLHA